MIVCGIKPNQTSQDSEVNEICGTIVYLDSDEFNTSTANTDEVDRSLSAMVNSI